MAKICLDAGHFGKYNRSPVVSGYYESDMTWKLHNKLADALKARGIEVIKTRDSQSKDLALEERGKKAKGCDLFLSVHSNACNAEGVDYPLACCLIDDKSTNIDERSEDIGLKLANAVHDVMGTKDRARILQRAGNNGDYYGVLRGAKSVGVPAVLLEHSFHTNARAARWLRDDANLDKLAEAEADILAAWLGVETKPTVNTTVEVRYRVQVGAFSERKNAENLLASLKKAGFDAFIVGETSGSVTTAKKSVDEIAREVIKGLWGNGKERTDKLKKAGYDASAVQKRVNELL